MGTFGYQFVHVDAYARKPDARGRSVDFVLSEAARHPDACAHIAAPAPPELIFGSSIEDLRALHDNRAASATTTIAGGKTRKVRQDQMTLMTVVASHPSTVDEGRNNPAVAAQVADWERCVIAWMRERWGDDLVSVVRHVDERHAHLHAFLLPSGADMRARRLHPGHVEKEGAKAAVVAEGADAKAANKAGDKAYCAAMREMQDSFWNSVGVPCGLARIGPARRRLTRAEWHAEKTAVAATAKVLEIAEVARAEADTARQAATVLTGAAEVQKIAAEALEARAIATGRRAQAAIRAAREQSVEAKTVLSAALVERAETERQARLLAARGRRLIEQARAEAHRIVGSARAESERLRRAARGIGAWIGAVVYGLRGVAPAKVARDADMAARAEEQSIAAARIASSREDAERTRRELRQAEVRLAAVSEAAARLGAQRDRLAGELGRLRPDASNPAPTPRPK